MNPEIEHGEYARRCQECHDKLVGHEDESGTHCRWCNTSSEVTEAEMIARQAELADDGGEE